MPSRSGTAISVDAKTGAFWVDYIADIGDGFEADLHDGLPARSGRARRRSRRAGVLRHGDILIMGGDQCYPQATREDYKKRLQTPYDWAFDVPQPERKLFAIPGNHDWYDGLTAFDSLFCASRDKLSNGAAATSIGGWQCQQHRSYWAIRLPHNWWIWGTDIQFSKYLDMAQVNYFAPSPSRWDRDDKLIICMAQPNWLMADLHGRRTRRRTSSRSPASPAAGAPASAPSSPATGTTMRTTSRTISACTSSRPAAAAPSCIRPTC